MEEEQILKWNNHGNHLLNVFRLLRRSDQHADVTLFSGGKEFSAHKVVLSACSDYFATMLRRVRPEQAPIIFLDLEPLYMYSLLDYMYIGQVQIKASDVTGFLEAAQKLKIKGLWIDPSRVETTQEDQFQKNVQLGLVHSDYLSAQFAPKQQPAPMNTTFIKPAGDRHSSRSPPPKRKRTSSMGAAGPSTHLTTSADPISHEVAATLVQPADSRRSSLPNGGGAVVPQSSVEGTDDQKMGNAGSENKNDNPSTTGSPEVNPLPLVKIEMEENANEEDNLNGSHDALNGQNQFGHELKIENDSESLQDPLTVDGPDGCPSHETSASPDPAAAATVHEYLASDLQQQLQQQQHLNDIDDDDGDVSSDDADMPALVVNEDNPDQMQNHECTYCKAKLANQNLLRRHIEDLHKQMRKHLCQFCNKAFKRKEHLERHVRIHTGDKPFECTICQTKFTQKEHLKGHIDNVHFKKKTSQRRNVKIAPAGSRAGSLSTSESSKVGSEQSSVVTNGPVSGSLVNGNPSSRISVLALSSDALTRGGKKPLLPRVSDSSNSTELSPHGGLLGRMVGPSNVVANSIGGAMTSNLSTALNLLAATATAVAPHLSSSPAATDGSGGDDHQLSSRNSSPPSLTSPTTLALSTSNIPFSAAPFAGSIFSSTNFPNLMLSNTTNSISSTFMPTITSVSPLNSVFTANLPNTTFSTSPNAAFQNQDGDTVVKELRINCTVPTPASSRGSGRGRGRGALARRGKTSKLPRVSLGRGGLESPDNRVVSPSSSSSVVCVEGGSSPTASEGSSGVTASGSSVKRKSPSTGEKHIKKVVLNYH